MKLLFCPLFCLALTLISATQHANAAPIPLSGTTVYTQNFDTLGTVNVVWQDDTTLPGWWAQINNGITTTGIMQVSDGSTRVQGLLNLGPLASPERALGASPTGSGNLANIAYGVQFRNVSASPITLSQLSYAGELWRTNEDLAGRPEKLTLFWTVSNTLISDLKSGANNSTAVSGTGFAGIATSANFSSTNNFPVNSGVDGNSSPYRTVVSSAVAGVTVPPGQYLMLKWTDTNESSVDGAPAIDDVSLSFTALDAAITATATKVSRNLQGTPTNPADDTFGFTVLVNSLGTTGPSWIATGAQPPAGNSSNGAYGTPVTWSGFPVAAPKTITFFDSATAAISTQLTVTPPTILGQDTTKHPTVAINRDTANSAGWSVNESLLTSTLNNSGAVRTVTTSPIDLSSVSGLVRLSFDVQAAETSTSDNFESNDTLRLELTLVNAAGQTQTVNLAGDYDANGDGVINGDSFIAEADEFNLSRQQFTAQLNNNFTFRYIIADDVVTAILSLSGVNNSSNESFTLKNLLIEVAPPSIEVARTGAPQLDNKGTITPTDDTFSVPFNVTPVALGTSTSWTSPNAVPSSRSYAASQPVAFGPFLVSAGDRTLTLRDSLNSAVTTSFTIIPPVRTMAAPTVANIIRNANGPGVADDTVTFDLTVMGNALGPQWATTGDFVTTGIYGTQSITVPVTKSRFFIIVNDQSYPSTTQSLFIDVPGAHAMGALMVGGQEVASIPLSTSLVPDERWTVENAGRIVVLRAGANLPLQIIESSPVDINGLGPIHFSANITAEDRSTGSNFESVDRIRLELIVDEGMATAQTINVTAEFDTGDGNSATLGTGLNGPKNGFINGYDNSPGTDILTGAVYSTIGQSYNANRIRDEFNPNQFPAEAVYRKDFSISMNVPGNSTTVKIRISGVHDNPGGPLNSTESLSVSRIILTTGLPGPHTIGQTFFGQLQPVTTRYREPDWMLDEIRTQLEITDIHQSGDVVMVTDPVNLPAQGETTFTAMLRVRETSSTSNFETTDRLSLHLILDGEVVDLLAVRDTGDGTNGSANGPMNGFVNGYQGTAGGAFPTSAAEYNSRRVRDEFNPGGIQASGFIDVWWPIRYTIPAGVSDARLQFSAAGLDSTEFFSLSQILFTSSTATSDTDGDGVTDLAEITQGTDPSATSSRFEHLSLAPHPVLPGVVTLSFSTISGRLYRGYYSADLTHWLRDDSTATIQANGDPREWTVVPLGARRYFQVVVGRNPTDFPDTIVFPPTNGAP